MVLVSNLYTANTCAQLSDPVNGNVRQPNPAPVGSVAVYTCNRGFNLVGSRIRVCQSDLSYSSQAPTCVGMCIEIEKTLILFIKPTQSLASSWVIQSMGTWGSQVQQLLVLWQCILAREDSDLLVGGEECVSQMAATLVKLQHALVCFCQQSDFPVVLDSNLHSRLLSAVEWSWERECKAAKSSIRWFCGCVYLQKGV